MMKYELVKNDCVRVYTGYQSILLFRIKALIDLMCVDNSTGNIILIERGDLGGYVQTEDNLSQVGTCWIHENAIVWGKAKVLEHAQILPGAEVGNDAVIGGCATVRRNAFAK